MRDNKSGRIIMVKIILKEKELFKIDSEFSRI